MKHNRLEFRFVEFIPERIEEGILYISIEYRTATHKCCCGCGREVVTPLAPTAWGVIYDGTTVSLEPSIGSWNLPCQSHYWIRNNRIRWAEQWTQDQIWLSRAYDSEERRAYFSRESENRSPHSAVPSAPLNERPTSGLWKRLRRMFRNT